MCNNASSRLIRLITRAMHTLRAAWRCCVAAVALSMMMAATHRAYWWTSVAVLRPFAV